jgi:hypothetical protein
MGIIEDRCTELHSRSIGFPLWSCFVFFPLNNFIFPCFVAAEMFCANAQAFTQIRLSAGWGLVCPVQWDGLPPNDIP